MKHTSRLAFLVAGACAAALPVFAEATETEHIGIQALLAPGDVENLHDKLSVQKRRVAVSS